MSKKLNNLLEKTEHLKIDDNTKIVIMSDCHRGEGNNRDNFLKNENIYQAALTSYYKKGFTYIELGDGDDMWEVRDYQNIVEEHLVTFKILKKFYDKNRLIMIYGNHDNCKQYEEVLKKYFYTYDNKETKKKEDLLNGLTVLESLILDYEDKEIFLLHGHQVDLLNGPLWRFSKFLVRHIWHYLEVLGIKDPTSAAKNHKVTKRVDKKLKKWSLKNKKMIVAGHTHRSSFSKIGDGLYFNDGSCIHPNGITCIEIENGKITLVKWFFHINEDNLMTVDREIIEGDVPLLEFFKEI